MKTEEERESVRVLKECIDLQVRKSRDYQNSASKVRQADYYRLGIDSIYDMLHTKMLRILSLIETAKANPTAEPNFESLEDTLKDLINYSSFGVAWLRKKIDGQDENCDMFNNPLPEITTLKTEYDTRAPRTFLVENTKYETTQ